MAIIEGRPSINPPGEPPRSPQYVRRIAVVVHDFGAEVPPRLAAPTEPSDHRHPETDRVTGGGRHRRPTESWLDVLEGALNSWPVTLRLAVLIVVLATGAAAVAAAVGVVGQLLLTALGLRAHRQHQARLHQLQNPPTTTEPTT